MRVATTGWNWEAGVGLSGSKSRACVRNFKRQVQFFLQMRALRVPGTH